jgi:hypothetical protein
MQYIIMAAKPSPIYKEMLPPISISANAVVALAVVVAVVVVVGPYTLNLWTAFLSFTWICIS